MRIRTRSPRRAGLAAVLGGFALVTASAGAAGASTDTTSPDTTSADSTAATDSTAGSDTTAGSTASTVTEETIATPSCEDGAERPLIYVLYKEGTQQYFIDQATGASDTAEALCADIKVVNVEQSGDKAVTEVQNAIAAGADAIGITVPDQQIGPQVAQLAADAGIPIIATDDVIEDGDGNPVPFAGFNGTEMGTKVGQQAADLLNEAGWIEDGTKVGVLSIEKQDLSVCNQRTDAEKQVIIDQGGVPEADVYPVASDATIDGSLNAASPVITAHPDVTNWIVMGCNDESVKGALQALAAAGMSPDNIIGVGLGAYEACKDWQADEPSGFKGALYISGYEVGKAAVTALYNSIENGVDLPPETIAATALVDPTNWEDSGLVCTD